MEQMIKKVELILTLVLQLVTQCYTKIKIKQCKICLYLQSKSLDYDFQCQ